MCVSLTEKSDRLEPFCVRWIAFITYLEKKEWHKQLYGTAYCKLGRMRLVYAATTTQVKIDLFWKRWFCQIFWIQFCSIKQVVFFKVICNIQTNERAHYFWFFNDTLLKNTLLKNYQWNSWYSQQPLSKFQRFQKFTKIAEMGKAKLIKVGMSKEL